MDKILLIFILLSVTSKNDSSNHIYITEYINTMKINPQYTKDKIRLAKRIIPLIPSDYIAPINQSINITENLIKILELKDYLNRDLETIQLTSKPVENNRERISEIVTAIQEEVPRDKEIKLGSLLETIIDIDKYLKTLEMMNSLMNSNLSKDTDKLMKMIGPIMNKKELAGEEGNIDIEKIMNIMNVLIKTKEKPKED